LLKELLNAVSSDFDKRTYTVFRVSNGDILSETNRRNTYTKNISEKSVTTASARNLGEISSKDVDKVDPFNINSQKFLPIYSFLSTLCDSRSLKAH